MSVSPPASQEPGNEVLSPPHERSHRANGFRDVIWVRRDPDLVPLHGMPEFEKLFPESAVPAAGDR
jgi:hypothetical protein